MTKKEKVDLNTLGTDAALWAEALTVRLGELGNDALDASPGGDLFGWVANMIEAGRSAGHAEGEKSVRDSFAEIASGADLSDVVNAMKSGHPIKISVDAVDELIANVKAEQRRAGLNDTGDVPVIDLAEANAVEFQVDGESGKVWLNVDGRCRARVGTSNIVISEVDGNRVVIFDNRNEPDETTT